MQRNKKNELAQDEKIRTFVVKLHPTMVQERRLNKFGAGTVAAWNLGLDLCNTYYEFKQPHNYYTMNNALTGWRANSKFMTASPNQTQQNKLQDLSTSWTVFFKSLKSNSDAGKPKFKSTKNKQNYTMRFNAPIINNGRLKVSKFKEGIKFNGGTVPDYIQLKTASVFWKNSNWWAGISYIAKKQPKDIPKVAVGIDVGVTDMAVFSDGTKINKFKQKELEDKKKKIQRKLAKQKKGSKRRLKTINSLRKVCAKIADKNALYHHTNTKFVASNYNVVVLEDLKIKNLTKSAKGTVENPGTNVAMKRGLNREISSQAWYKFRRMLEYKMEEHDSQLIFINPSYTSQTCSKCGGINKDNRNGKSFLCLNCAHEEDADFNAAKNILTGGLAQNAN